LHVGVFAGGFILAPFMRSNEVPYVPVVPIEILSEAEIADRLSVKADQKSEEVVEDPADFKAPDPEVAPKPEPEPEPEVIPPPREEPKPEPKIEEKKPEPEKAPEPKPEPPKQQPKPDPKKDEAIDDLSFLDNALVDLEKTEKKAPQEVLDAEGKRDQEAVGLGDQLTATEMDLVRAKMAECYDQPTGVPDAEKLVVRVRLQLDRQGEIQGEPTVVNARQIAISNNSWWRATRDRAVRAAIACEPYDYLPQDRYYIWADMTLNFTPLGVM
jgi:outer membrane biosynthesis protein TonB